jgi:hypothetical protein
MAKGKCYHKIGREYLTPKEYRHRLAKKKAEKIMAKKTKAKAKSKSKSKAKK